MKVEIPVSIGELIDKLTILRLKMSHVTDDEKLASIQYEKESLEHVVAANLEWDDKFEEFEKQLFEVNSALWHVEDELRDLERESKFSNRFVELARTVYRLNDRRFALKDAISRYSGSEIREEKLYAAY